MPYSEGAVGHQNPAAGGGYFSPDSKTPAVTTSQVSEHFRGKRMGLC